LNKELASTLRNKLTALPFVDKLAALVQTVEDVQFSDDDAPKTTPYRNKFPVSYDVIGAGTSGTDYQGREKDLVPDSSKKSIIYFEDFGSTIVAVRDLGLTEFNSKLRLICWLNRQRFTGDAYSEISAYCIAAILGKLAAPPHFKDNGIFKRLNVKATAIPAQNADLFSRYTYDQTVRQFLRPPFEFFGIDLSCNYHAGISCFDPINFNIDNNC
jgi:hypothetical protein